MRPVMIQGTSSGAGKTVLTAALCRIFSDMGYKVAPFKSQNMSSRSFVSDSGIEISTAQAMQAAAARCEITADLNPVLLKPRGGQKMAICLEGKNYGVMDARHYYEEFVLYKGLAAASASLESLLKRFDLVVLEGAGSPAEINLAEYDIANMRMAKLAAASVLLVCDIDRGGAFASLAGTMKLLPDEEARLVRGFVMNKFRGDPSILRPGFSKLEEITAVPVVGVIPMFDLSSLPDEDSLDSRHGSIQWSSGRPPPSMEEGICRLAATVRESLDMDKIVEMVACKDDR